MGSGETSPPMVTIHKALVAKLGNADHGAILLDTPYAFQENASEIIGAGTVLLRAQRRPEGRSGQRCGAGQAGRHPLGRLGVLRTWQSVLRAGQVARRASS